MAKKRVHEIAKERGISSKEVLAVLQSAGFDVKAAASSVDENDIATAFDGGKAAQEDKPTPAEAPAKTAAATKAGGAAAAAKPAAAPTAAATRASRSRRRCESGERSAHGRRARRAAARERPAPAGGGAAW